MNNDLISRAEILKVFGLSEKTRKYGGDHSGYDTMMLYEIQNTIEDMESVSAIPLSVIEDITHEIRKYLEDVCINENEAEGIMFCLDVMDKHISGKENK